MVIKDTKQVFGSFKDMTAIDGSLKIDFLNTKFQITKKKRHISLTRRGSLKFFARSIEA